MEVKATVGDIIRLPADAILVGIFEGEAPQGIVAEIDQALDRTISNLIADGEIKGKLYETTIIHTMGKIEPKRVAILGLGQREQFSMERIRRAVGEACRRLKKIGVQRIASIPFGVEEGKIEPQKSAQAIVEGCILGTYTFLYHKTKPPEEKEISELVVVSKEEGLLSFLEEGCALGKIMAEATNLARDMVNQPANIMTPTRLAEEAKKVAEEGGLEIKILDKEDIAKLGMGAFLAVAQGSYTPPKFIIMEYKGGKPGEPPLGLVGKGITFDTGGISLKPAEGMWEMKGDMAGVAAIIAAMKAIAQLKPKINVSAFLPATENMPGGSAFKPGDVLQALNKKTIEVISTDAEGRLILADAFCYAKTIPVSCLVDLSTLTGACHIALGDYYSGAFSNNPELLEKVIKAGKEAGERHWAMPMDEDFKDELKSEIADIKNVGGRWGGAITAALFLAEFVGDTPWVHLDIAGTARSEKERGYIVKGATGFGVRTLINLVLSLAEEMRGGER